MTDMQTIILITISEYINENDKCPTIRDIAYDLEKSPSTIHYHLSKMKNIVKFNKNGQIEAICQN